MTRESAQPNPFVDDSAVDYDVMVDWGARLGRELPFFRALFEEAGVSRLVDVGCGTGQHASAFAGWELDVLAIDPSESMLEQARKVADESGVTIRFELGGYGDVAGLVGAPADALVSLGNAFMYAAGFENARAALGDMAAALRPGGILVLHFLNHDRLLAQKPRMMPARLRETPTGTKVFVRVLDYEDDGIAFDFITLARRDDGEWDVSHRGSFHEPLLVSDVSRALDETGFEQVEWLGSHDRESFDVDTHESAIVVAVRGTDS